VKKLGVLSDTHDQLERIAGAMQLFQDRGAEGILHCGDIVAPFALKALLKANLPLYAIFGNNDGEKVGMRKIYPQLKDGPCIFEIGGRKLGVAHSVEEIPAEYKKICDGIFYGHSHERVLKPKTASSPLELNPGEACGWLTGRPSCAMLDLETMQAEIIEIV
jgi:uncharacterized protein